MTAGDPRGQKNAASFYININNKQIPVTWTPVASMEKNTGKRIYCSGAGVTGDCG